MSRNLVFFLLVLSGLFAQVASAQVTSRSGFPAPSVDVSQYRLFPCAGNELFAETFQDTLLPTGWLALDYDGLLPDTNINNFLVRGGGWQSVVDYRDKKGLNRAVASPSWYQTPGRSDDYLISPRITLGSNTCLSWTAYSQDQYFPESYEVLISTTTPDTAGFFAHEPLLVVEREGYALNYRSVNLAAYAGQQVYLAFHHTSLDEFILVLDDIRVADVPVIDLAVFDFGPITADTSQQVSIRASLINYGSDTLFFDSTLVISYVIGDGDTLTDVVERAIVLAPNDTLKVVHDSIWVPTAFGSEIICFSVAGQVPGDENPGNNIACRWASVGTTAIQPARQALPVQLYPNPVSHTLYLDLGQVQAVSLRITLLDLHGKPVLPVLPVRGERSAALGMEALPAGMYLLRVEDENGQAFSAKVVKQ
jgi:hypothetical protein